VRRRRTVVLHRLLVLVVSAVWVLPVTWMVSVALFEEGRGLESPPLESLGDPHPENFARAMDRMGDFPRLLLNTSVITVLSIAGQLICCSLAGFAFACLRFRGRDLLFVLVLATMMLPPQVTTVPQFLLFRGLGLVDTFAPLVLPTVLGGAPFFIFLCRQAFLGLPRDLLEAARMDGAGWLRTWWRVMLPCVKPMAATVAIFTFLATWNDFWAPLVYLLSQENQTLSLALASFNQTYNTAVELMMAAASIVLAPCVVVYFVFQRIFIRGVSLAASKR